MTHKELTLWVQSQVHSICPYPNGTKQFLYHAGFLASVVATLIEHDSANAHIYKRIIAREQRNNQFDKKANSYNNASNNTDSE